MRKNKNIFIKHLFAGIIIFYILVFSPIQVFALTDNSSDLIILATETYTLSGTHTYTNSVQIYGTLFITQYNGSGSSGRLELSASTVIINGKIDATGKGYPQYQGPGAPTGNTSAGGSYGGFGGMGTIYGSIYLPIDIGSGGGASAPSLGTGGTGGGAVKITANTLTVNGVITANGTNGGDGSYGGNWPAGGGSGGSVYINANIVIGTGTITANGGSDSNRSERGCGGGGGRIAIYYMTNNLTGIITSYGGPGALNSYGGAGTIYLKSTTQSYGDLIIKNNNQSCFITPFVVSTNILTFDSILVSNRANLKVESGNELITTNLTVTNNGIVTNEGKMALENLTLESGSSLYHNSGNIIVNGPVSGEGSLQIGNSGTFYLNTKLSLGNLTVVNGGILTHTQKDSDFELEVHENLTIDTGGKIDVTGKGYPQYQGPGAPTGNTSAGGSYGGFGGMGLVYGSMYMPTDLGSGGGASAPSVGTGGTGGGAVKITANTLTVNGAIIANGTNGGDGSWGGNWPAGGGSGGSVYITANTISGTGTITANGGSDSNRSERGCGGGGGRIAIYYTTNNFTGIITAYGGAGAINAYGGAGTIYLKSTTQNYGDLTIDNNNSQGTTPIIDGVHTFDKITVKNKATLEISDNDVVTSVNLNIKDLGVVTNTGNIAVTNFKLENGGAFYHNAGILKKEGFDALQIDSGGIFYLNTKLSLSNLTIFSGGILTHSNQDPDFELEIEDTLNIQAGGKITVDGKGYPQYKGPGAPTGNTSAGGSYGGFGGMSSVYGSMYTPTDLGSGGGASAPSLGTGGAGGGAIKITANTLTFNGIISANGTNGGDGSWGGNWPAGGGSGGSVYIKANTILGNGTITSNGGNGSDRSDKGNGGGGGRIAIYYNTNSFTGSIISNCGIITNPLGNGTIVLKCLNIESPVSISNLSETYSKDNLIYETLKSQRIVLNNTVFHGESIVGSLNFQNFEKIDIKTGSFADKGLFKSSFTINVGNASYPCFWKGISYLNTKERNIYMNGYVEGAGSGIIEAVIQESVVGSGNYDIYNATLTITEIGSQSIADRINLSGSIIYQTETEYPNTKIHYLQTAVEGTAAGYYTGNLTTIITLLRIDEISNPCNNEGFSIMSYNSSLGSGMSYSYVKKSTINETNLKGAITGPIYGLLSAYLDESVTPKKLSMSITRLDYGKPPQPDLKVKIWGPGSAISPGQTITYTMEVRNDGLKDAENMSLIVYPSAYSNFGSAVGLYTLYDVPNWIDKKYYPMNMIRWDINIPAKTVKQYNCQSTIMWGLTLNTVVKCKAYILTKEQMDSYLPTYDFTEK
ncbi:MAG: hypothetical protein PHE88_04555 [Elusimicrobia bacterium]|nr:hypothetical protein [Elusimicrobiota bacterium]